MTDPVSQALTDSLQAVAPRRPRRKDILDSSVATVEQALLTVSTDLLDAASRPGDHDLTELDQAVARLVAMQLRLVAEALHWHG